MIPGFNILNTARRLIRFQEILFMKDLGRTTDSARQYVTNYAPPIGLMASVQAVKRDKYQEMGLEFQKKYTKIFCSINLVDINRDETGDQFIFGGELYQMESETTWFVQDGWASCLSVVIKKLTPQELASYERQRSDRPNGETG